MKIKICGITNLEDAITCANLGADAIGFIFYKESKRYIEPDYAKSIIDELPPFLVKVGVFVNEKTDEVNRIAQKINLSMVQLHGDEEPEYTAKINYPVIKAFRVKEEFDFTILEKYRNCFYLLDSFSQTDFGGTGNKFNWNSIPNKLRNSIIIAGGISINNIERVSIEISPYAVDVSSSVEIEPGIKDLNKLKNLFKKFNELKAT